MLNEIFILLGIKSTKSNDFFDVNNVINNEKSFLMNVSNVLNCDCANKILNEIPNNNFQNNNMLINFVENVGFIGNLDEIEIKNNEINSNFVNGIKQTDFVNHKANLKFSDDFKNKMNDFELPKESEKITIDGSKFNKNNNVKKEKKKDKKSKIPKPKNLNEINDNNNNVDNEINNVNVNVNDD